MAKPTDKPNQSLEMKDFLNPASMLTPGLAGSMTMLITNALSVQFELTPSWTGLLISFLCGTLVFIAGVSLAQRLVYYVLNSLIIFSVAAGTSGFAAEATNSVELDLGISRALAGTVARTDSSFAVAQTNTIDNVSQAELQMRLDSAIREAEAAKLAAEEAKKAAEAAQQQLEQEKARLEAQQNLPQDETAASKRFFKSWF